MVRPGAPKGAGLSGTPSILRPSHFLPGLIAPTEGLQERRRLSILHRLVLCSGVLCGRDLCPCISLPLDFFSGILRGPYLSPRTLDGPDASVLLHGPERCWDIFCNLCLGIFRTLCRGGILHNLCRGTHLCVRIILGRPSLELPKQGFRRWLTIFRLTLTGGFRGGSNFVAGRRVLCDQRQSLKSAVD